MKKIICAILVCAGGALCGEESLSTKRFSPKVNVEVVPFVYGALFQPGYGVSLRTGISAHTFELAPMSIPLSGGYFGNSSARIGITGSYYYSFRKDKIFQPYLGCSFTHLRDTHRKTYQEYRDGMLYKEGKSSIHQESSIDSVIGLQICIPNEKFVKAYFFGDILGFPIGISDHFGINFKYADVHYFDIPLPRIGVGLQF